MFGLGMWEIVVVAVVALLVLGPKRLPEMAKQVGKAVRELRRASADLRLSFDEAALKHDFENLDTQLGDDDTYANPKHLKKDTAETSQNSNHAPIDTQPENLDPKIK